MSKRSSDRRCLLRGGIPSWQGSSVCTFDLRPRSNLTQRLERIPNPTRTAPERMRDEAGRGLGGSYGQTAASAENLRDAPGLRYAADWTIRRLSF